MISSNCGFTGYRPARFTYKYNEYHPDCLLLKQEISGKIIQKCCEGYYNFYTGMAMGIDIWAAEAVLAAKKDFYNINLIAVVPFKNHIDSIGDSYTRRYNDILAECSDIVYVNDVFSPNAYLMRNRYIVDNCAAIIAVYDPDRGIVRSGTAQTVNYAKKLERDITVIVPKSLY
ncbi:MAG: DUF1273 family protein [Clostridia bacterium]|nr:DUF1273 family protein [Clostridia bacterium]